MHARTPTAAAHSPIALTSQVVPVHSLPDVERDEMWALYQRFYAGTNRALFDGDLQAKDSLLLLRDPERCLQGFSTLAVGFAEHEGRVIRYVFSGDTIVDRAHWGSQSLAFTWLRYVGDIKRERPELPLYWFLIVKGHRTYRYLPTFARTFWPTWTAPTPPATADLMARLARERFGAAYDLVSGVVRYPESRGHLVPELAEANDREAEREDVRFFLAKNPGYRSGDELVCLCELDSANLRPLARRIFDGER